jgi:ubiquinone/menaquinone biosynthesis C-methylase UbiE
MKLNLAERLMTNSPVRALSQRWFEAPAMKKFASSDTYPRCLEIGCGRGAGSKLIVKYFNAGHVTAIDIDPMQVERAQKALSPELRGRITFEEGDAMELAFPDGAFDAVFSFGVIHHMEDWRHALAEIARVLKPEGELFYLELLRPFLTSIPVRLATRHPEGGLFTRGEFEKELENTGLLPTGLGTYLGVLIIGAARKRLL